jgi:hypothetical protein
MINFSPSSTTKTGRHDIAEILLKVALNTKIEIQILFFSTNNDFFIFIILFFTKITQICMRNFSFCQ